MAMALIPKFPFAITFTALLLLLLLLLCRLSYVSTHPDDCDYSEDTRSRNGKRCNSVACKHLICKEQGYKVQASYCDRGYDAYLCCCNQCNLKLAYPGGNCKDDGIFDCSNSDYSPEASYCLMENLGCCLRDDLPDLISDDDDDDSVLPELTDASTSDDTDDDSPDHEDP